MAEQINENQNDLELTDDQVENMFDAVNCWQCKICGEYVPTEYEQMRNHLDEHDEDEIKENCPECNGEKFLEVADGEDSRKEACFFCNKGGDIFNEDAEYERQKDAKLEAELEERKNGKN